MAMYLAVPHAIGEIAPEIEGHSFVGTVTIFNGPKNHNLACFPRLEGHRAWREFKGVCVTPHGQSRRYRLRKRPAKRDPQRRVPALLHLRGQPLESDSRLGNLVVNNGDGMGVRAEFHTGGKVAFENERNRLVGFVNGIIDTRQRQKRACGIRRYRQTCG